MMIDGECQRRIFRRLLCRLKLFAMKKYFIALAFILGMVATVSTQAQDSDYVFRIKVAASKTAISKTSKLYKDFPDAKAIEFPDGYIRYFVGEYETFHHAKENLPAIQQKGYKDAYVVCIHEGKILTGDEAIMQIYEGK